MARITEEASATVTMNMEPARKSFEEWTDAVDKGKKKLEELLAEADRPGKAAAISDLKDKIAHATSEAEKAEKKLKTFRDTLSNLKAAPFNDLVKASKELESQIKKLTPGTEEYIAATHDLKMVNTRLKDLREGWRAVTAETEKSKSIAYKIAEDFKQYWSMFDVGMRTITGVSMKFRQCAEDAAKLDDVYADVMKTTGLLHGEVAELDEELKKIDTRTSREQLLLLARDAGKLGIQGKENILGFVRAADQIQVALGEDLGEGAVKNLGKIADVLGYTKSMGVEKALLSIGSAVNAVGQASTASEGYLVEFTQRMAGVGQLAHLSAANIIGFASGLDQSAMKVEMASTAFQKFMMKLYSEPEKFAKYAKQSVDDFSKLMKTDANAAMIEVLKGLKEIGDMSELTSHFDEMGLDGARTVQVLGAMASNLDAVTVAQALANEEFEKATSIGEEYATKNNNLQAQLEKARKEFHNASITLGQSLNPILLKSTKATTYLIKALASYGKEIKTVLIVIAALTVALKAKVIWQKAVATWNATLRTGSLLLAAAQALLAGNVTRAAAAWRLMNTAMKASVIGVAVAAVSALVIALQRLNKNRKEANILEQKSIELDKKAAAAGEKEIARVKHLNDVVHDQMRSYYERNKALEELKKLVPEYQASLTKEGELINDNTEALDDYIKKIRQAALEKMFADELADLASREIDAKMNKENHQNALDQARHDYSGDAYMGHTANEGMVTIMEGLLAADEEVLNGIAEERKQLTDKLKRMLDEGELTIEGGGGSSGGGLNDKEAKKAFDARIKQLQKQFKTEERELKISLLKKEISEAQYDAKVYAAHMENLRLKLEAARQYGQDDTDIQNEFLDMQIKAMEKHQKEVGKIQDAFEKVRRAKKKKELDEEAKQLAANAKRMAKEQEILEENLADAKALINESHWKEEYDFEKWKLDQLHDLGLLSERDYQTALLNLKLSYAQKGAEKVGEIASEASNFVTALREMESAQLEAQYQADLTAAGDNAEKREQIENEYEQKQLDLKKKYADTEMAINIAKTVAAGAVAAIKAYAEGGPYLGIALAALIAATTAAEVATIIAQRNAIKNTSVSSGSKSAPKTGKRTLTGYAEGGYTEDHTTLTTVGERGTEWVAPAWMVRRNPVMIANLERYRKAGSHGRSGSMELGFAEGGFTGKGGGPSTGSGTAVPIADIDWQAMREFNAMMHYCAENGLFVKYGDIKKAAATDARFKSQTTRG